MKIPLQDTYNNIHKTFFLNQKALILDTTRHFPLFAKHLYHLQNNFENIFYYMYSRYFKLHATILAFSNQDTPGY